MPGYELDPYYSRLDHQSGKAATSLVPQTTVTQRVPDLAWLFGLAIL